MKTSLDLRMPFWLKPPVCGLVWHRESVLKALWSWWCNTTQCRWPKSHPLTLGGSCVGLPGWPLCVVGAAEGGSTGQCAAPWLQALPCGGERLPIQS